MIEIILNGEKTQMKDGMTLVQIIESLGFHAKWVVAELNGQALMKSEYPNTILKTGDKLELVRAVSGG
jgi:sulfur carrier protein